ncbi:hypothetical protein ACFSKI_19040 [Pseudogracilibacillus auburnensis]|uniref:Uncharacterized protein n=1 Tax=Pseudogracilibacillus auburnensis TaxID=1494959 RepID=A0A2V3W3X0_9BACI|nr:hypothetical protein [Pseudogracilibacillus auburnensis]PXW88792.1 hypothetical protein DFR56_103298 [Pseudogracilibacillus auburnensis]
MKTDILKGMKSVMVFEPNDSKAETKRKWDNWWKHNKESAVADKFVPGVKETRKMLNAK